MMTLTISLKVKADFVCFLFKNEFGVIYWRCYAECLLWFCGGFFFSKGEFWSTISHLSFFGIVAAQFFSDAPC